MIPASLPKAEISQGHQTSLVTEILHKPPKLLVFSASSEYSLEKLTASYADHFKDGIEQKKYSQAFLDDLAYTLGSRRTHLAWRSFSIAPSSADLLAIEQNSSEPRQKSETSPRLGFVFTGQGAQWYGMGQELMAYPVFQKSIYESDTYLRSIGCTWSVLGKPPQFIHDCVILTVIRLLYAKVFYEPRHSYSNAESDPMHGTTNSSGEPLGIFWHRTVCSVWPFVW